MRVAHVVVPVLTCLIGFAGGSTTPLWDRAAACGDTGGETSCGAH